MGRWCGSSPASSAATRPSTAARSTWRRGRGSSSTARCITGNIASGVTSGNEFAGPGRRDLDGGRAAPDRQHGERQLRRGDRRRPRHLRLRPGRAHRDQLLHRQRDHLLPRTIPQFYTGGAIYVESQGDVMVTGSELHRQRGRHRRRHRQRTTSSAAGSIEVKGSSIVSNVAVFGGGLYTDGRRIGHLNQVTVAGNMAAGLERQRGSGSTRCSAPSSSSDTRRSPGTPPRAAGAGSTMARSVVTLRNTILAGNTALTPPLAGGSSNDCLGTSGPMTTT